MHRKVGDLVENGGLLYVIKAVIERDANGSPYSFSVSPSYGDNNRNRFAVRDSMLNNPSSLQMMRHLCLR